MSSFRVALSVVVYLGAASLADAQILSVRGDANSNGAVEVTDIEYLVDALFAAGPQPPRLCLGDANADGFVSASDVFFLINGLFGDGPMPTGWCNSFDKADLIFAFDTTGSMSYPIGNVQAGLSNLIPQVRVLVPDVAFGLLDFRDFGDLWVVLYRHRIQTVSTSAGVTSFQTSVNALAALGGGDGPEAGWEAMYSIAGGPPLSVPGYSSVLPLATTPPQPPTPGETQGTLGGAGFRSNATPIVVAISDAEWHDAPGSGGLNPYGAELTGVPSRAEAIARLNAISARVISLVPAMPPGGDPRTQARLLAEATGSTVPPATWGAIGSRPFGCPEAFCCTGVSLAGEAPSSPGGACPLVYRYGNVGAGVSEGIVNGVEMLLRTSR